MTNYDHLITLPVELFNTTIISIVNEFGGNSELLLRYLQSEYVGVKTIRDILSSNFSGANITFRYCGLVYECVSASDFVGRYGTLASGILDMRVKNIRTGKNGSKTLML